PEPPTVVLAAAQRGDVARVEIRGPGIGGSPVHLPIARAVVERHGGVLQPHELPGKSGTTYVVELPLDPAAAKAAAERAAAEGRSDRPKEGDSAVLPELPGIPQLPSSGEAAAAPAAGQPGAGSPEPEPVPAEEPPVERRGRRGRPAAAEQAPTAPAAPPVPPPPPVPAAGTAPAAPADQWPNAPARIERAVPEQWNGTGNDPAYGRQGLAGPDGAQSDPWGNDDGSSGPAYAVPVEGARPQQNRPAGREPLALGPAPSDAAAPPDPAAPGSGPAEDSAAGKPRRRRALPSAEDSSGGFALPGVADTPVYPGLEHALPVGPAPAAPEPAAPPTGRRRRLSVPPGPAPENAGDQDSAGAAGPGSALEPARSALPAAEEPGAPQPVGSGLAELTPPRPLGAAPVAPVPPQPPVPAEARTAPRPMAELPAAGPSGAEQPQSGTGELANARRLLVWPEPDPATNQALRSRGYQPVIVRSREEVAAQVTGFPAALFVDPLTGPITRTALQSLRTAALDNRVPVLVTAGLGQATRDAAYGADPAVLLRALAPRDGEHHAPRVLLVEGDPDIAAAMISSLERRGMHVEHATDENDAVARAASVQPNLVVMDLFQIRRRRVGLLDWLRANDRLHRTPLVVYTSVDLDPRELPRLRTGETVLFLAERSTTEDVQSRIVDLLGRIGAMGEAGVAAAG
ncbi:hybrid sensor histidine kinase/response regulator, partial [Kitasatospora sp. NPDC001539]|uniref:hybrid sensor histidine kinase/response regulator n=1 Tax=Kitasatospora sp. NPDC001539 TaxID=3154384 RepID=UPI0033335F63